MIIGIGIWFIASAIVGLIVGWALDRLNP